MELFQTFRRCRRRLRGLLLTAWIRASGGSVGSRLECEHGVHLRWKPHRGIRIGDGVYLGVGVIIDVGRSATLELGDGVKLMHYTVIAVADRVSIGPQTQIAESCSVRDADHGLALGRSIKDQPLVVEPVSIGADAWLGRGVAVLRGVTIGDGAVVGANSVVRGAIPARVIAVGAPARVVRHRAWPAAAG